jgi:hypothetical protein
MGADHEVADIREDRREPAKTDRRDQGKLRQAASPLLVTPQPAVAGDLRFDPDKPVVANIAEQRHETHP